MFNPLITFFAKRSLQENNPFLLKIDALHFVSRCADSAPSLSHDCCAFPLFKLDLPASVAHFSGAAINHSVSLLFWLLVFLLCKTSCNLLVCWSCDISNLFALIFRSNFKSSRFGFFLQTFSMLLRWLQTFFFFRCCCVSHVGRLGRHVLSTILYNDIKVAI